jgi:hypothetical protein
MAFRQLGPVGKNSAIDGLELVVFKRPLARFPVRKCKILNGTTNYQLCARQGKTGNSSRISNEPLSCSYKRVVRCSAMEPCYQERLIGSHLTALVACNAPFAAMIFARLPLLSPLSDHLRGWSYFRFGSKTVQTTTTCDFRNSLRSGHSVHQRTPVTPVT